MEVEPCAAAHAEEDRMCRYCLGPSDADEPDDPLISPCRCKGGQEWCHLSCLKRWQRSVLVTQPTHPAFYERDERQFICNVCNSHFAVDPPSRSEMMASFTGPELAALLEVGCLIVCEEKTSRYMAEAVRFNSHISSVNEMKHWIEGVYLITSIEADAASDGEDTIVAINVSRRLPGPDEGHVGGVEARLAESRHHVGRGVTLFGLKQAKYNGEQCTIIGRTPTGRVQVRLANGKGIAVKMDNAELQGVDSPAPMLTHYAGGPCYPANPTAVTVLTAMHPDELKDANVRLGGHQGGLWVSGDLDDVAAVARSDALRSGQPPTVDCMWGDARWSRVQLLAEIARGSWGVCRAEVPDLCKIGTEAQPVHVDWHELNTGDRLVYAAKSEMTDEDIHAEAAPQMTAEEEDAAARELQAKMLETQHRLRAQLLAQQRAAHESTPPSPHHASTQAAVVLADDDPDPMVD